MEKSHFSTGLPTKHQPRSSESLRHDQRESGSRGSQSSPPVTGRDQAKELQHQPRPGARQVRNTQGEAQYQLGGEKGHHSLPGTATVSTREAAAKDQRCETAEEV